MKIKTNAIIVFGLAAFIGLTGCATRTKYQPNDGTTGGYVDFKIGDNLMATRFTGNAKTNKNDVILFSQFRATEYCYEQGFKSTRLYGQNDLTTSQTVQKTSSYTYQNPTYVSGNSSSNTNGSVYGRHYSANTNTNFNGTVSGGGSQGGSQTWNETYYFPTIDSF